MNKNNKHWSVLTKEDVYNNGRFQYLVNFYQRAYSDYRTKNEVCHLADLFKKESFTEKELIDAYNKDKDNIRIAVNDIISTYGLRIKKVQL